MRRKGASNIVATILIAALALSLAPLVAMAVIESMRAGTERASISITYAKARDLGGSPNALIRIEIGVISEKRTLASICIAGYQAASKAITELGCYPREDVIEAGYTIRTYIIEVPRSALETIYRGAIVISIKTDTAWALSAPTELL